MVDKKFTMLLLVSGWMLAVAGNLLLDNPSRLIALILGLSFTIWGCYLWVVKIKNRHPAYCLFGFLSPVGLLGIWFLKNKLLSGESKE